MADPERPPWRVLMTLVPIAPPQTPSPPHLPQQTPPPPPRPSFHLPPPHLPRSSRSAPLSASLVRCMAVPASLAAILVDTDGGYTYSDQTWWPYQLVQWLLFLVSLGVLILCVVGRLVQAGRTVRMWLLYHGALLTVTSVVFIPQMDDEEGDDDKQKMQWRVPGLPFSIAHLLAGRDNSRQAALLLLLGSICLMSLLYYCIHTALQDQLLQLQTVGRAARRSSSDSKDLPSYEAAMRCSRAVRGQRPLRRPLHPDAASWNAQPPNYEEALRAGAVSPFSKRSCLFQQFSEFSDNPLEGEEPNEHVVVVEDIGGAGAEDRDRMVVHIVEELSAIKDITRDDIVAIVGEINEHGIQVGKIDDFNIESLNGSDNIEESKAGKDDILSSEPENTLKKLDGANIDDNQSDKPGEDHNDNYDDENNDNLFNDHDKENVEDILGTAFVGGSEIIVSQSRSFEDDNNDNVADENAKSADTLVVEDEIIQ